MANTKSALKRARQNVIRRTRTKHVLSTMRTEIKKVRAALESKDADAAKAALPSAVRALSRAANKGVIHVNQARRKIGRLTVAVNAIAS